YWSAATELMKQICAESIELYRNLSAELESDTQFRDVDLLLTIAPDADPDAIAALYANCLIPPKPIDRETACELEPLLSRGAIVAALHNRHGHVEPELTTKAYIQAMLRLGGTIQTGDVVKFTRSVDRVQGVTTTEGESYTAAHVVVCAGGFSRKLLQTCGITVPCYYTQAELIETPPVEMQLQSLVMPAGLKRFALEAEAGRLEAAPLWDEPDREVAPAILDAGVVQFLDRRLRIGQISRTLADLTASGDAAQSEAELRAGIGQILPTLQDLPGTWASCLVAFSGDRLPLIGAVPFTEGLYLFSGFSNPFAILPPLARRFAGHLAGQEDDIIPQLSPQRFV
ncbi:MAG TPA: FAD-dependent oxidoreductase, partial [Crinalium sp.]